MAVPRPLYRHVRLSPAASDRRRSAALPADVHRTGRQERRPDRGLAGVPLVRLSAVRRHDRRQVPAATGQRRRGAVGRAELRVVDAADRPGTVRDRADAAAGGGDAGRTAPGRRRVTGQRLARRRGGRGGALSARSRSRHGRQQLGSCRPAACSRRAAVEPIQRRRRVAAVRPVHAHHGTGHSALIHVTRHVALFTRPIRARLRLRVLCLCRLRRRKLVSPTFYNRGSYGTMRYDKN